MFSNAQARVKDVDYFFKVNYILLIDTKVGVTQGGTIVRSILDACYWRPLLTALICTFSLEIQCLP
jgi:hypothetical protein